MLSEPPVSAIAKTAAASPNGTVNMMMMALTKLSNCAASTSSTTSSAKAKVMATPLEVSFSAAASPR